MNKDENKLGGGKMVLAPREELKRSIEGVVAVAECCDKSRGSPDQGEYQFESKEHETWLAYVNRVRGEYPYGLSYENGC